MTCMVAGFIIHQEEPIRPHFLGTLLFIILLYHLFSHPDPAKLLHPDAVVLLLLVWQQLKGSPLPPPTKEVDQSFKVISPESFLSGL